MERFVINLLGVALVVAIAGCSANNAVNGKGTAHPQVYEQQGMEISKTVSDMTDTLYKTMIADLSVAEKEDNKLGYSVVNPSIPKVAVTSFVDTDTYEDSGYLGRSMAELFIHELDRRGIRVFEYKLTGSISVTKDGEFVFSRNWKKIAKQAMVRHILAGTITRNKSGIVVVGRVINMANSTVVGSSTGFIPYDKLPYCYRTGQKNCSLNGVSSYYYNSDGKFGTKYYGDYDTSIYTSRLTPEQEKIAREKREQKFKDNYYSTDRNDFNKKYYVEGAKLPGTSNGNYERYMYEREKSSFQGNSPVIYPAQTYVYKDRLVRDVHDASQYSRVKD